MDYPLNQLKEFFHNKPVHTVLDIGTGTGYFVSILDDVFEGSAHITGVDPDELWLKGARERFLQNHVEFRQMKGEKLQFENHSFDAVSMSKALHHLSDIVLTMTEIKRVLKSNGWVIINEIVSDDLNEAQENQKMLHHFKSFVDLLKGISHRETWSKPEVIDILQGLGLHVQLSFPHGKTETPVFEELFLNEKYEMMEKLLEALQGRPEYNQMADKLPIFKKRLKRYGFQTATQLMVVGQFD